MSASYHDFGKVFEAFSATAGASPDKPFLCIPARTARDYLPDGAEYSYRAALERIEALRALYAQAGIGHGHRVALLLGNRPEYFFQDRKSVV